VDAVEKSGDTPLYIASTRSNESFVQMLIEKGANVNAIMGESGRTLLGQVVWDTSEAIMNLLLSNGANPLHRDKEGRSLLMLRDRPFLSDSKIILLSLWAPSIGEMLDNDGNSVFHWASQNRLGWVHLADRIRFVQTCGRVFPGVNVRGVNKDGVTPRDLAMEEGYDELGGVLDELGNEAYYGVGMGGGGVGVGDVESVRRGLVESGERRVRLHNRLLREIVRIDSEEIEFVGK
jgi:ankyrin repeat protein